MATPVFVFCENNCKYEGMTKEQILTAIMQAVKSGTVGDSDTGFITTVKTINGRGLKFFVGTQAEYDGLSKTQKDGVFALITNDTTKDGLLEAIRDLQEEQSNINNTFTAITTGAYKIPEASHAVNADYSERTADVFRMPIVWRGSVFIGATPYEFLFETDNGISSLCYRYIEVVTSEYGVIQAYIYNPGSTTKIKVLISEGCYLNLDTFGDVRNEVIGQGLNMYTSGDDSHSVTIKAIRLSERGVFD